ncbi:MAG: hypothetical protein ABW076_09395 [Candidatus Thiodiazotropha sp.]
MEDSIKDKKQQLWNLETKYYRLHAWGSAKNKSQIQRLEIEAENFFAEIPSVLSRLRKAKAEGELANQLTDELRYLFNKGEPINKIEDWIVTRTGNISGRVEKSIILEKNKQLEFRNKQKSKAALNRGYRISSEAVVLKNGVHPNFLPALEPSQSWTIAIDETGRVHDPDLALGIKEIKVGKFVALVIPDGVELPELKTGFHATDESHAEVELNLKRLTDIAVGIFGFSVKDPVVSDHGWYLQIDLLIRWVLRILPIDTSKATTVKFEIEGTGSYQGANALNIRGESILAELKRLSPKRYEKMQLNLRFVAKNECAFNGYVDTIANCWGSPTRERKALLRHFKLLDHCLLTPSSDGLLERTLIALNDEKALLPDDWYLLASSAQDFGSLTLVDDVLDRLGKSAQDSPALWAKYLSEVKDRIKGKNIRPHLLSRVISWLDQYKPSNQSIPKLLDLQYRSACLTLDNHQGLSTESTLKETVSLALELLEEDAPQACEVVLRAVISITNAYNFDELTPYIDILLKEKSKVFGLCNYGKLLSTRGQLSAFQGDFSTAITFFDKALESFARLSDPTQREKEILQTKIYRLFSIFDNESLEAGEVENELNMFIYDVNEKSLDEVISQIPGWGNSRRFAHHLLIRALATKLMNMQLMEKYINSIDSWKTEVDHPWQLIAFYRALLLLKYDKVSEAKEQIRQSLEICDAHPEGTITWIGVVIGKCAEHFGILSTDTFIESERRTEIVRKVLPNAPIDRLEKVFNETVTISNIDIALKQLLPFNFR